VLHRKSSNPQANVVPLISIRSHPPHTPDADFACCHPAICKASRMGLRKAAELRDEVYVEVAQPFDEPAVEYLTPKTAAFLVRRSGEL
jgi:hypothetical protein